MRPQGSDREAVFGWDVGGAHLKLAVLEAGRLATARQLPCPLWQGLEELRQALKRALDGLPPASRHAVTMTGEFVDLFADRASGVVAILGVLGEFMPRAGISVYGTQGEFLTADVAEGAVERVASANWHATTTLAARALQDGLLVDIGSTTTDLVPFRGGAPRACSLTDAERLTTGELVYTGIVRTPLTSIAREVPFGGKRLGVMAEYFANAADAHRLTGTLPPDADLHPTADGRGKTEGESRTRLARMIGMDAAAAPQAAWELLADAFVRRQIRQIEEGIELVLSAAELPRTAPLVGAGAGRFIAAELARRLKRPYTAFEEIVAVATPELGSMAADIAPAVAVAMLLATSRA
jgi:probable H4MPT-linked C1 transfer pathway protein